ncbi:MAG: hypothetical protein HY550_05955 [Elusimicrobia bacterium]|nr:hypothetical protein [Elusimicrobiota bacterium]
MKKSNILIAVFTVMSAASAARAQININVDFDGTLKAQSKHSVFTESLQIIPDDAMPVPTPSPIQGSCAMYCPPFQANDGLHVVSSDCCGSQPPVFPPWIRAAMRATTEGTAISAPSIQQEETFLRLNVAVVHGVIQGAIESCAAEGKGTVMINLKNLLDYGTTKEKAAFVYNKRGTYSFPAGIIARRFNTGGGEVSGNKSRDSLNLTCNSWTTVQVCTNRQVCRIACAAAAGAAGAAAGGSIGAGAAIGASGQICQELCENVKECSNVRECASWSSTAGTGTDAHGHYRGRAVAFQN